MEQQHNTKSSGTGITNLTRYAYAANGFCGYRYLRTKRSKRFQVYLPDNMFGGKECAFEAAKELKPVFDKIIDSIRPQADGKLKSQDITRAINKLKREKKKFAKKWKCDAEVLQPS